MAAGKLLSIKKQRDDISRFVDEAVELVIDNWRVTFQNYNQLTFKYCFF